MASRELARSSSANDRLRQQFAPAATDGDLAYFAKVCRHLQVDPWAGHIALIGRLDGKTGELVHKPTLTVAGRRFIAQRTGRLRGIIGPQWCGPRPHAGAPLEWLEVWDQDGYPYAARCLVLVADWDTPANGTVKWSEFAQRARTGGLTPTWHDMPSHMLGKVAESLALRRGFSEVASAVAIVEGDDDDASLSREVEAEAYIPPPADPPPEVETPTVTVPGPAAGPPPAGRPGPGLVARVEALDTENQERPRPLPGIREYPLSVAGRKRRHGPDRGAVANGQREGHAMSSAHHVDVCTKVTDEPGAPWWELQCVCGRWFVGLSGADAVEGYVGHLSEQGDDE